MNVIFNIIKILQKKNSDKKTMCENMIFEENINANTTNNKEKNQNNTYICNDIYERKKMI